MSEWQDISTAPRDGTPILIFAANSDGRAKMGVLAWDKNQRGWCFTRDGERLWIDEPTHWQPLPEPPTQGSDTI